MLTISVLFSAVIYSRFLLNSHVTKAWGYFLWASNSMYISSSGGEGTPRINYSFSTGAWYDLKSVIDGTNVKIYINGNLVKEITISGSEADAKSNNYVGLWCHGGISSKADSFQGNGRLIWVRSSLTFRLKRKWR